MFLTHTEDNKAQVLRRDSNEEGKGTKEGKSKKPLQDKKEGKHARFRINS